MPYMSNPKNIDYFKKEQDKYIFIHQTLLHLLVIFYLNTGKIAQNNKLKAI